MKLVLELKNEPNKDDVIVFNGKQWECVRKAQFLNDVTLIKKELAEYEAKQDEKLENWKAQINSKLSEYHQILQLLVSEQETEEVSAKENEEQGE